MAKKSDIDDSEKDLFRTAMRGVKPLPKLNKADLSPPPPSPRLKKTMNAQDEPETKLSDHEYLDKVTSEALLEFRRSGIQHKVLRKLRAGQYNIEAILDMHGMTVAEAKDSLTSFLHHCHKKGACHLLIVHGKGRVSGNPVLKNKLNHWLREIDQVLAFCSASAKDGRSGALYVLVKNQKTR